VFNSLSKNDLRGIVHLEVAKLQKRLGERRIQLDLSDDAYSFLADVGFDPVYGARPLKRTIQRELETKVAQAVLKGEIKDEDIVAVDVVDDEIQIRRAAVMRSVGGGSRAMEATMN